MTVRQLLAQTDSRELSEWMAYEKVAGPLGGDRGDIQAAIVAATVANVHRGKSPAVSVKDFLPEWDKKKQTWQDILSAARAAFPKRNKES